MTRARRSGQALVEAALVTPLLLALLCGAWALGVLGLAAIGLDAAVFEAARAAATADSEAAALAVGPARGRAIAADYGLGPDQGLVITISAPDGYARGGVVVAEGTARVAPRQVPLFGRLELALSSRHQQPIGRWRSLGP